MGAIIKYMFNIGVMRTEGGEVTRSEVLQIPRTILWSLDFIFYLRQIRKRNGDVSETRQLEGKRHDDTHIQNFVICKMMLTYSLMI